MKGNMADMLNAIEDTLSDAGVEASTNIVASNDMYSSNEYDNIANFIEEQGIQGLDVLEFMIDQFGAQILTDEFVRDFRFFFTGEYDDIDEFDDVE